MSTILVTALTKARMLASEAATIISGAVDPTTFHLILTKHDGTTVDAGYVKGDTGATSPPSGTAGGDLGGTYPNPTILKDQVAATASMRTLGTAATQAAPGNDSRFPKTWLGYTPTLTNIVLGNGTLAFRYVVVNKMVKVIGSLTFGSTTTISTNPYFSLPVGPGTNAGITWSRFGNGSLVDISAGVYRDTQAVRSGSTVSLRMSDGTNITSAIPWTWAVGDLITIESEYEID